jgi:hypothetical protein
MCPPLVKEAPPTDKDERHSIGNIDDTVIFHPQSDSKKQGHKDQQNHHRKYEKIHPDQTFSFINLFN